MDTLVCSMCHQSKPVESFARCRTTRSGYQYHCKACQSAYKHQRYSADIDSARAASRTRKKRSYNPEKNRQKCTTFRVTHPDYHRQYMLTYHLINAVILRTKKRTKYWANPVLGRAIRRVWCQRNPDKLRLHKRAEKIKRRARKAQALSTLSVAQEQEIKAVKGYRCDYCGTKDPHITIDHLTPLGPDGPDTLWNVTVACRSCNAKKARGPLLNPVQPLLLTLAPPKRKKA